MVVLSFISLNLSSGQALGNIVFEVLPDDLPETEEEMTLTITEVTPAESQRLRPGATEVKVIIEENDNPGGTFQFAPYTPVLFTVQVMLGFFPLLSALLLRERERRRRG